MKTPKFLICIIFIITTSCATKIPTSDFANEIILYREDKIKEHLNDPRSPIKTEEQIKSINYFPGDASYKVEAKIDILKDEKPFDIPTYSGIKKPYIKYGILRFKLQNRDIELEVYQMLNANPMYKTYLFLPFKDLTSGDSTYGGGRYINLSTNDIKNNKIILDFNKAYNPWCAYSEGFNCPIPPKANHMDIQILAGEKNYSNADISH